MVAQYREEERVWKLREESAKLEVYHFRAHNYYELFLATDIYYPHLTEAEQRTLFEQFKAPDLDDF